MIEISEGRTGNYFVYGVGVILVSFILIATGLSSSIPSLIVGVILFVFSILLFLATNGLDISNEKFRKYSKVGGVKIGQWHSFLNPESVLLRMHVENGSKGFGASFIAYVPSMNTKVISYDIVLIDEFLKKTTVYEFLDYKIAKKAMRELCKAYNILGKNNVAEKLAENRMKRRR